MDGPETIFVDRRVAPTIPAQPNPEADQIQYFRWDVVRDMVAQSGGPAEFVVHVTTVQGQLLVALTNYGRMFTTQWNGDEVEWVEFKGPTIEPPAPESET